MRPLFSFTISNFLVAIPLAWYGFGFWSLVAMQAVDIIVSAATLGFAARKLLVWPRFSRRAFDDLWRLSLGYTINQPFSYAAYNADRFIIGRGLGTATLGIYTRASFFANTATTLFGKSPASPSFLRCPKFSTTRSGFEARFLNRSQYSRC